MYSEKNIFLDIDLNTKDEVLDFICEKVIKNKLFDNKQVLLNAFNKRETEASTAFEDGFAIPHAKVSNISSSQIICVRTKKGIEWNSLDGKLTNVIIALIIPENANNEHLEILSSTASKLMNEELRGELKKAKNEKEFVNLLLSNKKNVIQTNQTNKNSKNIVAITSCIVGVAHTYMAEDKLISELTKAGYNIRVETQGSKGIGTPLSTKEIENADIVIIAADTQIDLSRFKNKLVYKCPVARCIKEPLKVVEDAFKKAIFQKEVEFNNDKGIAKSKQGVLQHILVGISYMIPVIILGGICLAFSLGVAKAIWGPGANTSGGQGGEPGPYPWNPLSIMEKIGGVAFTLMIPILAAFIANSIGGRAAIAPAMIGGFVGNDTKFFMPLPGMSSIQTPTGFIGAIISGLIVGYYVKWVNGWNVHKALRAAMPIFFIPLTAGIGISILFMYVIGGPIGFVMEKFSNFIKHAYTNPKTGAGIALMLGILIGAMASFDMGGPINKIAFVTCSALISQNIYYPMGTMAAAIPIAPLGMGLSTIIFKRFFTKDECGLGISAIIMGFIGISEGAIPFAIRDPKRAIGANVLGGMLAGAIAGVFRIEDSAAHGGPIVAILGAIPYGTQTLIYFIAVASGVALTTLSYGLMLISSRGTIGSLKENHTLYLEKLNYQAKEQIVQNKANIQALKQSLKKENNQKSVEEINNQINKLNENIKEIKKDFSIKKQKAIAVYNEIKNEEKVYVKENKKQLVKDIKNLQVQKAHDLKNLKIQKKSKIAGLDKYAKKEYQNQFANNWENIVDEYNKNYINLHINLRSKFVSKYNQKIN